MHVHEIRLALGITVLQSWIKINVTVVYSQLYWKTCLVGSLSPNLFNFTLPWEVVMNKEGISMYVISNSFSPSLSLSLSLFLSPSPSCSLSPHTHVHTYTYAHTHINMHTYRYSPKLQISRGVQDDSVNLSLKSIVRKVIQCHWGNIPNCTITESLWCIVECIGRCPYSVIHKSRLPQGLGASIIQARKIALKITPKLSRRVLHMWMCGGRRLINWNGWISLHTSTLCECVCVCMCVCGGGKIEGRGGEREERERERERALTYPTSVVTFTSSFAVGIGK